MDRGMIHYKCYRRSVDQIKFIDWLKGFKRKVGRKGCYLYMDNLAVHKTAAVRREMELMNIEPVFAPVYSPEYNPIEYCFSQLKRIVKKYRLQDMINNRQRDFNTLIPLAVA